jgi:hypothetical protein
VGIDLGITARSIFCGGGVGFEVVQLLLHHLAAGGCLAEAPLPIELRVAVSCCHRVSGYSS